MIYIVSLTESILTKQGNRHPSLANALALKGTEVTYISGNFYHAEKRKFSEEEIIKAKNSVPYRLEILSCLGYNKNISLKRILSNLILSFKSFLQLIKEINKDDIIIIPSRPVELIFLISILKIIKKCRIILDVEDIWPDALVVNNKILKYLFKIYCDFYLYKSIKYYDRFLTISPSYHKWIKRYNGNKNISFIPLGYEQNRWKDIKEISLQSEKKINFVLVAVLQFQIDVAPFIEAIANNENYHLYIIGEDGKGQRYEEIITLIETKGIRNVTFIGRVDPAEMQNHLNKMDIGISPIISPLLPNKFFDYLGACLPIFNIDNEDMEQLVIEYKFGWSCSNDPLSIKKVLKKLNYKAIQSIKSNILSNRSEFERNNINKQIIASILKKTD